MTAQKNNAKSSAALGKDDLVLVAMGLKCDDKVRLETKLGKLANAKPYEVK
jgi:hypothetical protein